MKRNKYLYLLLPLLLFIPLSCTHESAHAQPNASGRLPPDIRRRTAPEQISYVLKSHGIEISKSYNLQLLATGNTMNFNNTIYSLRYLSLDMHMSLDQARILGATLVEKFKAVIETSDAVKNFIAYKQAIYSTTPFPPNLEPQQIGYQICCWDEQFDRPHKPFIAAIYFFDSTFHYYVANEESQALELIFEEPYENVLTFKNTKTELPQ